MPIVVPPQPLYKTGIGGFFAIAGTQVFISKWDGTLEQNYADATDSSGFSLGTLTLWRKQVYGSIAFSGTLSGFWDFSSSASSAVILTTLLTGQPVQSQFNWDPATPFISGLVNIKNFKSGIQVEGGTTIGFDCDFSSYGVMTPL